MPQRWVFHVGQPFLPDLPDPFAAGLGGTEQAIIRLTSALAALGEQVSVFNGSATSRVLNGVRWETDQPAADIDVAINDASLLPDRVTLPIVWMHNEVAFTRELRRGRLPALLRTRPIGVFVGTTQARQASRLLPFRQRAVIPLGLSDNAVRARAVTTPPGRTALFTSQAYRGLKEVLELWQSQVAPRLPDATLQALIAADDVAEYSAQVVTPGVTISPRIANDAVIAKLRDTRVLLAPGHASETFCLAAAEAIALGVPVITLGRGALAERVRNGVDGFICSDWADMAARTRTVLTDDMQWMRLHREGQRNTTGRSWYDVARMWLELVSQR